MIIYDGEFIQHSAILQPSIGTSDLVSQTFCFVLYHIWPLVCSLFRFLFPIFVESLREEQCLRFCSPNFHANSEGHLWDPLTAPPYLLQELFAWHKPWRHAAQRACFAWKKPAVGVIALRGDVTLISRFFHLPSKRLHAFSKEMISKDSKVFFISATKILKLAAKPRSLWNCYLDEATMCEVCGLTCPALCVSWVTSQPVMGH